jgi:hypothetical protein
MQYEGILPDTWEFETKYDGGHTFNFSWQPLNSTSNGSWNEVSKSAFQYIKNALDK